jgi:pyruvate dehydrogenase E1 component
VDHDDDPIETQEWLEAADSVVAEMGSERLSFLLKALSRHTEQGIGSSNCIYTPYVNTLSVAQEPVYPGNLHIERQIRSLIRWNAMVMVVRAQKVDPDLGGHIGTFASAATLYDVGFHHCWRAPTAEQGGDLIYIQGHSSPGIYARSYLEGRLDEERLIHFRRETGGQGLSSYPHPWLMPDYWQFPTVSMGLGPLQAIYQARFLRYLEARGQREASDRKVWCFCGDGEMDEIESLGALSLAGREGLDHLIFVVNCNLQRLDGPVRGNGKIIQELEGVFHGAGWNVIKVIWGSDWDPLLEKDKDGLLKARMMQAVDGDYQNYKAKGGAYTREHFFGSDPRLKEAVADINDHVLGRFKRGGHDPQKVYAAYQAAMKHTGQPTVILAKTVKGYGLGMVGEAKNTAHNTKKLGIDDLRAFRDRFYVPVSDAELEEMPFYKPKANSEEAQYLRERREVLGGFLPQRRQQSSQSLPTIPALSVFGSLLEDSGERAFSTTTAFVRILSTLCKDKTIGASIVPIVPDEARTFGMEGLFRQLGIYAPKGQNYEPVDADQLMFYKEARNGQILEEGINEAGAFCSWLAAATSYSVHDRPMIPFYIYYSMFGFQRIGDLAWLAGDSRARGFLIGGTAGRTTLNGEGLQHQDGHSHLLATTIPNCRTYDPCFAYEVAVIIRYGLQKMMVECEDAYFYLTTMNENYTHPSMPAGCEEGIIKGIYRFQEASDEYITRVQLLGAGVILREAIAAAALLAKDFQIGADVWSVTSFTELRREALAKERHNHLHPASVPQLSYIEQCLSRVTGPVIAVTDYMRALAEPLRSCIPQRYYVLGTDGFGRSDKRSALRSFFEVDRYFIAYSALKALADEGEIDVNLVSKAMQLYGIDAERVDPWRL